MIKSEKVLNKLIQAEFLLEGCLILLNCIDGFYSCFIFMYLMKQLIKIFLPDPYQSTVLRSDQAHINTINRSTHCKESYLCGHKRHQWFQHLACSSAHVYTHSKFCDTKGKPLSYLSSSLFEMPERNSDIKYPQPGARPHFLPLPDSSWFPLKLCWLCSRPPPCCREICAETATMMRQQKRLAGRDFVIHKFTSFEPSKGWWVTLPVHAPSAHAQSFCDTSWNLELSPVSSVRWV